MARLYIGARMTTATTGTGTIALGSAVSGYNTFANAGAADGDVLYYGIKDSANSEWGTGTYTAVGTTLTRTVYKSTNGNAAINLSGSAEVYISALSGDAGSILTSSGNPPYGFDAPINLQLNASAASSKLTVAVKGNNGNDPGVTNPVLIPFRDVTLANGDPVWVAVTAALSIDTNAVGASLGSASSTPFRFWVVAFNNGGTAVLALVNCLGANGPVPINEAALQSSTAMSGSATATGTYYTPNGTALSSKAVRILGYVEYTTGLTTAGTYASAPDIIQLFGPGIARPGQLIQEQFSLVTSTSTDTSANMPGNSSTNPANTNGSQLFSLAITAQSKANWLRCEAAAFCSSATSSVLQVALFQDSGSCLATLTENSTAANPAIATWSPAILSYGARSSVSGSTTFKIRGGLDRAGTFNFNSSTGAQVGTGTASSWMSIREIMG